MPVLTPPTEEQAIESDHPLWGRYRLKRGLTLLVSGSTVIQTQYPAQEDLDSYDHVYLGGYSHTISDAEAAVLTAAGYGAYIT
jgi:hypothetical protein